ncbi:MAG: hypothetical protein ABS76_24900 [Pelagibacterium sp. SCN 64-44]|nr:MAG: hypothetical protein ABS76_24900 [Pelagibacterium sp. SCN 64-44]
MAPGLSIVLAEKRFGSGPPLFADFRLDMPAGQVLALLGPSGIGKSTLLRLVAGIDRDFAGRIDIGGLAADAAPMPGFVFQDPRLLPWLTALDNIRLADPGMSAGRAAELLAQMGLAGRDRDYPQQLSGGMQRRVALARALAANPGLLLLDEPFVSLDAALAGEMQALLARVIDAGHPSVVLVSHDAGDAARLADRVLVLAERPVRIVADLVLERPRAERDDAVLTQYRARLVTAAAGQRLS